MKLDCGCKPKLTHANTELLLPADMCEPHRLEWLERHHAALRRQAALNDMLLGRFDWMDRP